MIRGFRRQYTRALWGSMEALGVDQSIERKILVAVGLQFAVSLAQTTLPFLSHGELRFGLTVILLAGAAIAFANTVLIVRSDFVSPITDLEAASRQIASGTVDVNLPVADQSDEVGSLVESFREMQSYLAAVAIQAEALSQQRFDSPALGSKIPGRFGRLLEDMTESLRSHIETVEADRDRFRLLAHLVSHDIPNVVNVIDGRIDLAREATDDPDVREHLDVVDDQTDQILTVAGMVRNLTTEESVEELDLRDVVESEVERVRDAYEEIEVSIESPDSPVTVVGNELLSSVFANLLTNAVEHSGPDPVTVDVTVESDGTDARVTVSDDGPGFGVDSAAELFDSVEPHSGLGLVKTVTERFEGSVAIDPTDAGATVTVTVPLHDQDQ